MRPVPHIIPYQGSKRKLASRILQWANFEFDTLYEPFVGSGAITLAAASRGIGHRFIISDKLEPLIALWGELISTPIPLANRYRAHWEGQLRDPLKYYNRARDDYNRTRDPALLLYLMARCVKNAIRFNAAGQFNQSPDKRRLGTHPDKIESQAQKVHRLLKDRTETIAGDFRIALHAATPNDLVYLDPPWQGTSGKRDPRYAHLLELDELIQELKRLNNFEIPFLLSFDGSCGDKKYGHELPADLELTRVSLNAGRSSQSTLLGRNEETIESLYISPALTRRVKVSSEKETAQLKLFSEY